jgi:hypothetical protein
VLSYRLSRAAVGAVTIALMAAPIAGARPLDETGGQPPPGSVQERNLNALSMRATSAKPDRQGPTAVRIVDDGFDWGSAAIGAGGATGLLLLAATGAAAATHRHRRVSALP